MSFEDLRQEALAWDAVQQTRLRMNNMFKAFDRLGRPHNWDLAGIIVAELEAREVAHLRAVEAAAREGDPWMQAVADFVSMTAGLGPAVFCVMGLIPPLIDFLNPAKLWAYLGLAVVDGKAVKIPLPPPPNNPRGPAGMHFSRRIRAYATHRIVEPVIRCPESPYRIVYDERRLHTPRTHPEWALERNKQGELTPAGHYHNDAIRYVAKRVWRDIWKVADDHSQGGSRTRIVVPTVPAEA